MTGVKLDIVPVNPTAGVYTLSVGSYRNRVKSVFGMTEPNFIVKDIYAWGPSGNYSLSLNDYETGIQSEDEGGFTARPGCHLHYPVAARKVYNALSTGTIHTVRPGNAADPAPVVHLTLDVWDSNQTI